MQIPNPATLLILVHHYIVLEPIQHQSETNHRAYNFLIGAELISPYQAGFTTTEKGIAHIQKLLSTKLPVVLWVSPTD